MLVIAHRGASASHPENTAAAFQAARDQGADGVELDVRRTADGGMAVCHDPHLPDGRAVVEVRTADLPDPVLTLDAALDACAGLTLINIEIKNWRDDIDFDAGSGLADQVVDLLRTRGELDDGRHLVSCFHLQTVDRVRALAPGLATAWLVEEIACDPERVVATTTRHGHTAIHPHHRFVGPDLVRVAHEAGIAVNAWTCDDPDRIRWLADLGVDAVVADDPAAALAALGR
jgi:glycerophosphoryl diester phosphodiesterase